MPRALHLLLFFLFACASERSSTLPAVRPHDRIEQAEAALRALDYPAARALAAGAVAELLARPEAGQDASWLAELAAAGRCAWNAEDARTAREAWSEVVEVGSRTLPRDDGRLLSARANLALALKSLGELERARDLEQEVLEASARTLPDTDPRLQAARLNLAVTIRTLGDLGGARDLLELALEAQTRTLPDDHADLRATRAALADTLRQLGDLRGARALQERVLETCSHTLPERHPDLQRARLALAVTLREIGELHRARELQEQALDGLAETLPGDHRSLQLARLGLASTAAELGDLARARELEEQVLEVYARTLPDEHPDLQVVRHNLAATLRSLGDLQAACALQEQVLRHLSRTRTEDHPDLQRARLNLAITTAGLGDLERARVLEEQALDALARVLPDEHPDLQRARAALAATLQRLGDLRGARALQEAVLAIGARTLPDEHPDLQRARSLLAITLRRLGDLQGARGLQEAVLETRERTLDGDDADLQRTRLDLAVTLRAQGDLPAARSLEEQVLEVFSRTLPENHPELQAVRGNLAVTLRGLGELARARELEETVLGVLTRTLPGAHPDLQTARGNLARTLVRSQAQTPDAAGGTGTTWPERSVELVTELCRAQAVSSRTALLSSSSREAEERCATLAESLGLALTFAARCGDPDAGRALERTAFELGELTRSAALASARIQREASGSARYSGLREELRAAGAELALLAQQGATSEGFQSARTRRERIERELAALAGELTRAEILVAQPSVEAIAASLDAGAAAVGYYRYTRWVVEPGAEREVPSLCAFVLRPGAARPGGSRALPELTRVELGAIEPIEAAVHAWRRSLGVAPETRGVNVASRPSPAGELATAGRDLRRRIFDPLLPTVAGAWRLVVALDDVLHLVPLDALPADDEGDNRPGTLLGDACRLELRVTLAELQRPASRAPVAGELVALGGAEYGTSPATVPESARGGPSRVDARSNRFAELPGAAVEAREVARLRREAGGEPAAITLLAGGEASRERLLDAAPGARWLHVATHGWFAPDSIRSWDDPELLDGDTGKSQRSFGAESARGLNPMLLCGLALAGANEAADELGRAPGLLTAEELSTLDLPACELAVLSACDTNVGERRAGQGVASLQKALHMAGARTVVTSLWKVPDAATRELMLAFYRRIWLEQQPMGQALWEAKQQLRRAVDQQGNPRFTPRDWAAWVLTGEPD